MDGHPLILLKHGGPSRKKASLYGKVAQIYFALRGSFLLCAQQRELISEVADLWSPQEDSRVALLLAALIEEMRHSNVGKSHLPAPRDPRLVRICTHIQQQLDDAKTLQEWALELGCDPRTLHRLFVQELGMSFVQWRQLIRLRTAMDWLAAGKPVVDVAFDLGYQNQSAFTTMFRRNLGMAPSDLVRARRRQVALPA